MSDDPKLNDAYHAGYKQALQDARDVITAEAFRLGDLTNVLDEREFLPGLRKAIVLISHVRWIPEP